MKFKLKGETENSQIVVRFEETFLPDVLAEVGSFLQGCGFSFGEQSLELVPWEEDALDEISTQQAMDVLFEAAMNPAVDQYSLLARLRDVVEKAQDTIKQLDYEAQLGK